MQLLLLILWAEPVVHIAITYRALKKKKSIYQDSSSGNLERDSEPVVDGYSLQIPRTRAMVSLHQSSHHRYTH